MNWRCKLCQQEFENDTSLEEFGEHFAEGHEEELLEEIKNEY